MALDDTRQQGEPAFSLCVEVVMSIHPIVIVLTARGAAEGANARSLKPLTGIILQNRSVVCWPLIMWIICQTIGHLTVIRGKWGEIRIKKGQGGLVLKQTMGEHLDWGLELNLFAKGKHPGSRSWNRNGGKRILIWCGCHVWNWERDAMRWRGDSFWSRNHLQNVKSLYEQRDLHSLSFEVDNFITSLPLFCFGVLKDRDAFRMPAPTSMCFIFFLAVFMDAIGFFLPVCNVTSGSW